MTWQPGDRAPDFVRRDSLGQPQAFYEFPKGRSCLLVAATNPLDLAPQLTALPPHLGTVLVVAIAPVETCRQWEAAWGVPVWSDDGTVVRLLAESQPHRRLILDANQRIVAIDPDWSEVPTLLATAVPTAVGAPVLLVPRVLPPELCDRLIAAHRQGRTFASGTVRLVVGQRQLVEESHYKRRVDLLLSEHPGLATETLGYLTRRLRPELKKAFHFVAAGLEPLKVARYDGGNQGFFAPHRDNNTRETARRCFALTLNLNDPAEYEGGGLRFPEYSPTIYRPAAGEALVFSSSHLHEVTPVRQGQRYVLITFFWR
ncbi:MAG: 2OG-Fe(II) oxygenase [Pseudanabaenaceae cyanobacterium]